MRRVEMKKQYVLGALIFVIALVTVGFALLQSSLSINGTVTTRSNSWSVHFNNVQMNSESFNKTAPTISNGTSLNFNVELAMPGDLYGFTVDAVNDGTIDAKIGNVSISNLTTEQAKLIDLSITYNDGTQIQQNDALKANSTKRIKVLVKYKDDINPADLPNSNVSINVTFAVDYVQADDTSKERVWSLREDNDSNGTISIGDLICVSTECFYVYSANTTEIKALAQYNLMVGNEGDGSSLYIAPPLTNPTGLQASNMRGYVEGQNVRYGTTAFSNDSQTGTLYSYYSGSIVEGYVNTYKTKLNNEMQANIISASLITKEEIEKLVNGGNALSYGSLTSNASDLTGKEWLYSTSYWTRSDNDADVVWVVYSNGYFGTNDCYTVSYFGVRPVITINASEFE